MSEVDEWMPAAQASTYLGKTDRQLRRYREAGRVRSRVRAGRVEYAKVDLDAVRAELPEDTRPRAPASQDVITAGQALDLVREQQAQIAQLSAQIGYQRAQLEARPALEDTQRVQAELTAAQAELAAAQRRIVELEAQVAQRRRWRWPWQKEE